MSICERRSDAEAATTGRYWPPPTHTPANPPKAATPAPAPHHDTAPAPVGFRRRAQRRSWSNDTPVDEVLTDNGPNFASYAFAQVLAERRILHRRTRPYRPQTNAKAERLNRTPSIILQVCGSTDLCAAQHPPLGAARQDAHHILRVASWPRTDIEELGLIFRLRQKVPMSMGRPVWQPFATSGSASRSRPGFDTVFGERKHVGHGVAVAGECQAGLLGGIAGPVAFLWGGLASAAARRFAYPRGSFGKYAA